jgi:hypothetical protein
VKRVVLFSGKNNLQMFDGKILKTIFAPKENEVSDLYRGIS